MQHSLLKEAQKAELIALSLKYGLVTQWTSFVAVEERHEGEVHARQPSLAELVAAQAVDDLAYLGFVQPLEAVAELSEARDNGDLLRNATHLARAIQARAYVRTLLG